jgi:hypothetical protein
MRFLALLECLCVETGKTGGTMPPVVRPAHQQPDMRLRPDERAAALLSDD